MCFIENLESRLFLSATTAPLNPTVKADRLAVRAAFLQFRSDLFASQSKLILDLQAVKANLTKGDTTLVDPVKQFRADTKAMRIALLEDRLAESANALKDLSTIKLDLLQIIKDRTDTAALSVDRAKLHDDRVTLQNDLIAGLDARIATRQANETTLSDDAAAIVTAVNGDANATDAMKSAVTTFSNDRIARLTTLTTDLQAIQSARTTLVTDLTAAQST